LNSVLFSGIGSAALHDVIVGSAGGFSAEIGWDFPTGVGTPNNLGSLLGG
jgi:hypothetical protein